MPTDILMPQLSPTMTQGRLSGWKVKEGDAISAGDVIAEVETDKATMEVEASEDGIVHAILGKAGEDIQVGIPIAVLKEEGEKVAKGYKPTSKVVEVEEVAEEAGEASAAPQKHTSAPAVARTAPVAKASLSPDLPTYSGATAQTAEGMKASPLAKRMAAMKGVSLKGVSGSGPRGRIVKKDVERILAGGGDASSRGGDGKLSHSPMRSSIASRLTQSKQTVPHFYLTADVRVDALLESRKQLNAAATDGSYKITVNDMIIKACAMALRDNPKANASWYDDAMVYYGNVDISVAVAIEDGLITPIVASADKKSIIQVSNEVKSLAKQAKAGALKPEQYIGGSFTISNLGMYGVKEFQAIINPPQAAILAVGGAQEQPIVENGKVKVGNVMSISMSVDHRAVDGALGAELLASIKFYLENPAAMLV